MEGEQPGGELGTGRRPFEARKARMRGDGATVAGLGGVDGGGGGGQVSQKMFRLIVHEPRLGGS